MEGLPFLNGSTSAFLPPSFLRLAVKLYLYNERFREKIDGEIHLKRGY
jgi:hypothetical protein